MPERAEKISVSPPTLPVNMSNIKMTRDTVPKPGVMPRVNPTVPTADAVSNMRVSDGSHSARLMTQPPVRNRTRYIMKIVAALRMVSS